MHAQNAREIRPKPLPRPPSERGGIPTKVGRKWSMHWCENDMLQMADEKLNLLQAFGSLSHLLRNYPTVTPSNNKVRNFWVGMTPYFFSQGINYRTVANPFGVAVSTVCRIVHETTKANVDNLTPECAKFSESDAEYFDALATFQAKHIPNGWFSSNRIPLLCAKNSRIARGQTLLVARP